jgi:hypothetical protein
MEPGPLDDACGVHRDTLSAVTTRGGDHPRYDLGIDRLRIVVERKDILREGL